MKSAQNIKIILVMIFLIVLVVGYFYYLSNKEKSISEINAKATKVQEVIMKDLDTRYPPTPKEVVKFYSSIMQCLYNETYSDEELEGMAKQMQKMYDDELNANNPFDKYVEDLKFDIESMKDKEYTISSYTLSASTDVEYYTRDGHEWARLHCIYSVRVGTQFVPNDEIYLLRKDQDGHWKIYGWMLARDVNTGGDNE